MIAALIATHPGDRARTRRRRDGPARGRLFGRRPDRGSVVAFRDPHGLRPLVLGRIEDEENGTAAYCVASETCAFDLIGAKYLREVLPGEVVT